jgi:hypothetical protein
MGLFYLLSGGLGGRMVGKIMAFSIEGTVLKVCLLYKQDTDTEHNSIPFPNLLHRGPCTQYS